MHIHVHLHDSNLSTKLDQLMATIAQLTEKVDTLQTKLDAEQEQVRAALATLQGTVDELKTIIADGGTAEQRQALSDKLDSAIADLEGTIADDSTGGEQTPGGETPAPQA